MTTPTPRKLTEEERRLIRYFYQEKGDITRWIASSDPEIQSIIEYWHPELMKAIRDVQIAERILGAVVLGL